jgi:hypothetical protein
MHLDLALQAFNLFNHAQFTPGSPNDAQFNSTATASVLSYVNASRAAFNDPTQAFNSHARAMQVTIKLLF